MKHSKLFLTGMAALLLSFGLMMTGCDSGGDSKSDPINPDAYISIEETTPGADAAGANSPVAAVYTVTVKQPVPATNKAVFANVADAAVEYIGGTGGTTAALQAAAIKTALTGATGAKYTAGTVDTSGADPFFLLTAKTAGVIATAPDVTIETYEAPPASDVSTAAAIDVATGDTALAVIATGGSLKANLKVFISTDGATVTVTDQASVTDAFAPATGATVAQEGLKIIVKGLAVAAANPNNTASATALKSGSGTVTVTLKSDAQASQITGVAAKTGVPVVIEAQLYTLASIGAGKIVFTAATTSPVAPAKVNWQTTGGGNSVGEKNLDVDFDAALIAVFTNTALGLTTNDTITFGTGGVVSAIGVVATPSAARLTAALGFADAVTLGLATTGLTSFTVPAGKTLDITGVDVGVGASAVVTVNGTLHVGDGSAADVTLTKAVITAAANANAAIFDDNTTGGALNLAAGDKVELADGGSITIAGSGSVVAGATTFDGAGAWTASGAAVTVTGSANGATLSGTGATLTATGASPKITQAAGSGNELTIAAGVTLDTTAASIVLKSDASNAGTLVLTPKTDSNAADGGGAKLVINSSGANAGNASVAKSGQTATNLTATGTAADTLTFTGTANTVITNIPANDAAAAIKSLEAATTTAANATNGTITLEGYATNDVTVSAAAKFRYGV